MERTCLHGRRWVLMRAQVQGLWLDGFEAGLGRYFDECDG